MGFKRLFLFALFSVFCLWGEAILAHNNSYREFHNIHLDSEASLVNCFVRDSSGLVWIGTGSGLYSYDAYSVRRHTHFCNEAPEIPVNDKINCGILINGYTLMLGTDNGVLMYNVMKDGFERNPVRFPADIRSLVQEEETVWIGALDGLYKYDIDKKQIINICSDENSGIPHDAIYSIIKTRRNTLYVGTYNGLCYSTADDSLFYPISLHTHKTNVLVNSLLEDTLRNCIWVGTEGALFKYSPQTQELEKIGCFDGHSIKSLAIDADDNLLLGTDNGLYVYDIEHKALAHIVHDSRNAKSLTNNIIWGMMKDRQNNMWFGTDYGISMYNPNKLFNFTPISEITGNGNGNQFYVINRDSRGYFWLGGTNGLIRHIPGKEGAIWYRMGDVQHHISHHRIRCVYEDVDKNLWVATDGSINRYDYSREEFIHYNIVDSSGTRNANWAYGIVEDDKGYLWITSYLGGVFVVDKEKLLNSSGDYVADYHLYEGFETKQSGSYATDIKKDKTGNIWILRYDNEIEKINIVTKERTTLSLEIADKTASSYANAYAMLCDSEGFMWVGYSGGLVRINPVNNYIENIHYAEFQNASVRLLTEVDSQLWVTTSERTFVLDKSTLNITHSPIANNDFSCSYYDVTKRQIYMGGVNGFIVFSPEVIHSEIETFDVIFTAMYVNGKPFRPVLAGEDRSIRYTNYVTLNHKQNNVSLAFSDLSYAFNEHKKYVYKIPEIDSDWRTVEVGSNRISYTNLIPGHYSLLMGELNREGGVDRFPETFNIEIRQPWYFSFWMKAVYLIIFAGIFFWIVSYFRNRHLLKIVRVEKEKSLELSRLKTDFFTNMSHELKTPLSMIIAPVGKLLLESKDTGFREQLSHIQRNALRLNTLIQQIIGIEQFDANIRGSDLILSKTEFIEFARSVFFSFGDLFKEKSIAASFHSNAETVLVHVDVVKMESILNNIISNACKYTPDGGKIDFNITLSLPNDLKVTIKDSGMGIETQELPYVFKRFYRTKRASRMKESSGIGLYLVKNYVELHGGKVDINSSEKKGTTVIMDMPIVDKADENAEYCASQVAECSDGLFKILIVEDNLEISSFIENALSPEYICELAHNGKAGLEKVNTFQPDIIIVDVMMPIMDGMAFVRQLKTNKLRVSIPIIMLTAKDDRLTEEQSIKLGIDAFVPKPFDMNMLLLRIEQLLHKKEKLEEKLRLETIAEPQAIEATSLDESFLSKITHIIEDKISSEELNVAYLSKRSGMGSKQIYRKIKQLTGLTSVEYIRTIRLKKAALLLSQQKFSVAEVMYLVGFSNASYFSKCFFKQYGKTPKQFMEE